MVNRGDEVYREYKLQRKLRGFDDSEIWNFDITLAKFIIPRLERFKQVCDGYPYCDDVKSFQDWITVLNKIIASFSEIACKDDGDDRDEDIINEGLDLFRKYYFYLWY